MVKVVYAQEEKEPVVVNGDRVEFFSLEKKVEAEGHVVITYKDVALTCDKVTVYTETKDAFAEGDVVLRQGLSTLSGDKMNYNFDTKKGTVIRPHLKSDPCYGDWKTGDKVTERELQVKQGYTTTCNLDEPHYRFQSKTAKIFLEDKVVARNCVFYVDKLPLFYLPRYSYSLRETRPKVTVIPGKDKDWGYYVLTAWRYEISGDAKGVMRLDYRERKDVAWGFDHYYNTIVGDTNFGKGLFKLYYMNERNIPEDHIYQTLKYRLTEESRDPTFERQRYRLQLRHDWNIDKDTKAILEYNRRSDSAFLKDYFYRREYEKYASPESYISIIRSKPEYTLGVTTKKRTNRWESVTENLPEIRFDWRRQLVGEEKEEEELKKEEVEERELSMEERAEELKKIKEEEERKALSPKLYYKSDNSFLNSNSKTGHSEEDTAVLKFNTYDELSFAIKPVRWLNFNPFVGTTQTCYSRKNDDDEKIIQGSLSAGTDLSTKIFRIFDVESNFLNMEIHRLKHIITPTIQYKYTHEPTVPNDKLLFGGGAARNNAATFTLENKLQTKRDVGKKKMKVVDLARFIASNSYDFKPERGSGFSTTSTYDLELRPYNWLLIEADTSYNRRTRDFETVNLDIAADGGDKWKFGFGSRYQQNTRTELTTEIAYTLSQKWRIEMYHRFMIKGYPYGIKKTNDIREQEIRLKRDMHCWLAELVYNVGEGETIWLVFTLKAFPEIPFEFDVGYHQPKPGTQQPIR
jgi:lipopolysaccharide assembly outer membrane protein LptD (OstA)